MAKPNPKYENASTLAAAVRMLARDARRALSGLDASDGELASLLDRIETLSLALGGRGPSPVGRWLESLRREVEAARLPALTA